MNSNLLYVLSGTVLFGISAGVLGCFALLRKRALMGDALAHAALPGVCLAYLLSGGLKHPALFIAGASVSGLCGSFAVQGITRHSRIKEDSAIGLVLSVFFGIGIMLLTYIQHQPFGNQSGIDKFLFGQAAAMIPRDVWLFGGLAVALVLAVVLAYKELKVLTFDPDYARAAGLPVAFLDAYLLTLIVLVVTAGLQAVGVVLMAAMLITPAAAARQWTDRLGHMVVLAGLFGATSGAVGAWASALAPRMPTGPWIVVAITGVFMVSIAFAPRHGILPRLRRHRRNAAHVKVENVLKTLYRLTEDHPAATYSIAQIQQYRELHTRECERLLSRLTRAGFVAQRPGGNAASVWHLTLSGHIEAQRLVRRHRLWEVYLTRYLHLGQGQVHSDAEDIEHVLTPELEHELELLLQHPATDPHQRVIPYEQERCAPKPEEGTST